MAGGRRGGGCWRRQRPGFQGGCAWEVSAGAWLRWARRAAARKRHTDCAAAKASVRQASSGTGMGGEVRKQWKARVDLFLGHHWRANVLWAEWVLNGLYLQF